MKVELYGGPFDGRTVEVRRGTKNIALPYTIKWEPDLDWSRENKLSNTGSRRHQRIALYVDGKYKGSDK